MSGWVTAAIVDRRYDLVSESEAVGISASAVCGDPFLAVDLWSQDKTKKPDDGGGVIGNVFARARKISPPPLCDGGDFKI